jgi:hypothetical protein
MTSKYISIEQLRISLKNLESIHQFYGITFLTCKLNSLPIGRPIELPINAEEKRLLDTYYKPYPMSEYYFRVFRLSDQKKGWLSSKYASSGLQSTRTREFRDAFLHSRGTDQWGWKDNYVEVLKQNLTRNRPPYQAKPIPAFHLAVWLYRDSLWSAEAKPDNIVSLFQEEFSILDTETQFIDLSVPPEVREDQVFKDRSITNEELRSVTGPPPDLPPQVGTLAAVEIVGVGPAQKLRLEPAKRITLITGDNGLGKSFLLECAWWALTGEWSGPTPYPNPGAPLKTPRITFDFASDTETISTTVRYDLKTQEWPAPKSRPTIDGLLIYARVDGSFAIWDPVRNRPGTPGSGEPRPKALVFSRSQVWNGYEEGSDGQRYKLINGLLSDWITWQLNLGEPFETFRRILKRLSPPDLGELVPGQPTRLPHDSRYYPTLVHPYGEVPIIYASAGVRRIVTLVYLIVWAWQEHQHYSESARVEPQRRMVVLIDELEAHLHPQWQRVILPTLLAMRTELASDLQCQYLIATHSPLVMASSEPFYDKDKDKLVHIDLTDRQVTLSDMPFIRHGPIDAWLTSEVFGLAQARSVAGEKAIAEATKIQESEDIDPNEVKRISQDLEKYLAADDEFWPRWVFFAAKHGVEL